MKIGFYTSEQLLNRPDIASSRIRAKWLIKHWPEAELYQYGEKYDVMVFQKVYVPDYAKLFPGIKILDICDPDWITDRAPIIDMGLQCDAITVSSPELQVQLQKYFDIPVIHIADRMDLDHYKEKKIHLGKAREVLWFGYSHNIQALKNVTRYLIKHDLRLSIISDKLITIDSLEGELKQRWTRWDLNTFNVEAIKSDMAIIPRSIRPNDRFKSNNRSVTAWCLGLPVVNNYEDLVRFLEPEERTKEATLRLEQVKNEYDVRQSVQEMKNLIGRLR